MRIFVDWGRNERGATAVLGAMSSLLVIGSAGLAVDAGMIFLESRRLQGVADLAALAAARDLTHAQMAATATVAANRTHADLSADATLGVYSHHRGVAHGERFAASATGQNAVRVEVRGSAPLVFAKVFFGDNTIPITRRATAARAELASISIGSRMASVNGGVANQVVSGLLGKQVNLTVMDYNALISGRVDVLEFARELQSGAEIRAASFDDILASEVTTAQALRALENSLSADEAPARAAAKLAEAAKESETVRVGDLFELGPYGVQDRASPGTGVSMGAMEFGWAVMALAAGDRQVKVDLGGSVPGLTDLDVWLAVGERQNNAPWLAVDQDGSAIIRTAQMRLYVEAKAASALGGAGIQVLTLPALVEMASAEAKVASLSCPAAYDAQAVNLSVRPSVGRVAIGAIDKAKLNDFKHPLTVGQATLVDALLIKVKGRNEVNIGGQTWKPVRFSRADIEGRVVKTVATDDIGGATVASAIAGTELEIQLGGLLSLGAGLSGVKQALTPALAGLGNAADSLIGSIAALAGVGLGEADVRVNGLRCRDAALVG